MSLGLYPEFNPPLTAISFACDPDGCCALLSAYEDLDSFASESGWRPLSSFGDNRAVPEDFEGDPSELDEILGPWDEWFSPTDALPTIQGLSHALENNPAEVCDSKNVDELLFELRALEDVLNAAAAAQVRFRLMLVE